MASAIDASIQTVFPSQKPWISYKQAVTETTLSKSTIYRLTKSGQLESRKVGNRVLISRDSLNELLRSL